jgi:tetratricopeptide (TPR) repeat protein
LLHTVVTRHGGNLRFECQVEDAAQHRMTASMSVDGDALTAIGTIALSIDEHAREFSSSSPEAIASWGRHDFERAIFLDPDFGSAWVAWVESLASNPAKALEVAQRALARPKLRGPVEQAQLDVLSATIRQDPDGRRAALNVLAKLTPNDLNTLQALADAAMLGRQFNEAADALRRRAAIDPADGEPFNILGYAEGMAGNLDGARKAFAEYRAYKEQNSFDSLGEVLFMNGKFADAEKSFTEAHEKDPAGAQGADLMKAAYAHWLTGDLPGADRIFGRYLQYRATQRDPVLAWREAVWMYATGRREAAIEKVKGAPSVAPVQLAVWNGSAPGDGPLLATIRGQFSAALPALKTLYQRTPPPVDSTVRVFYAWALTETGAKDEARALLTRWPLPDDPANPLFESVVFPQFIELRNALGVR